jgi:hypothetical protein
MNHNSGNSWFDRFANAGAGETPVIGNELIRGGYSAFSDLLDGLRRFLTEAEEVQMPQLKEMVEKGRSIIPDPGAISPSWETIWDDFDQYIGFKLEAMSRVEAPERQGEWQIVMNNPYTNEGIACYPGLSFPEASYLYAYFRKDLKKNEYLRMQKIVNLLVVQGD